MKELMEIWFQEDFHGQSNCCKIGNFREGFIFANFAPAKFREYTTPAKSVGHSLM